MSFKKHCIGLSVRVRGKICETDILNINLFNFTCVSVGLSLQNDVVNVSTSFVQTHKTFFQM